MAYKPASLHQLIEMANRDLFLPHIQRPFVWEEEQMKKLLDSLMCGYPVQTLLFWRTREAIKARRFMTCVRHDVDLHSLYDRAASEAGKEKVFVLDGQQRVQSLFAMFDGEIAVEGEPREAFLDLDSDEDADDDGYYYDIQFAKQRPGPMWYRLKDLRGRHSRVGANEIGYELVKEIESATGERVSRDTEWKVLRILGQLVRVLREGDVFWYEELDGTADKFPYRRVLDVFVRVNSGGTRLEASDLMFAAMKELSDEIEEHVEQVAATLTVGDVEFDKSFVLKCLTVALGRGAEVGPELFVGPQGKELMAQLEANWPRAEQAFDELKDFLAQDLRLVSSKTMRSDRSLIPLFDFLYHHPKPTPKDRVLMVGYFYKAQLFNWFTAGTDRVINALHTRVSGATQGFPIDDIKAYFAAAGRRTELGTHDLHDRYARAILLNVVYVDRHGTSPFQVAYRGNAPQMDHIYPKSMLQKKLGLVSSEVDHLGNFRYVGATDNNRKRAQLPDSYFQMLAASKVDIAKHLLVEPYASAPSKLAFDATTYRGFRDGRLAEIAKIAQRVVNPEVS